jgi:hypothetical protein
MRAAILMIAALGTALSARRDLLLEILALRHQLAVAVLACDFFIVVTATFKRLYVFVLLDIGARRIVHWNLTDHPRSDWTIQQFRNGLPLYGHLSLSGPRSRWHLRASRGRGPSVDVAPGVEDAGASAASERVL